MMDPKKLNQAFSLNRRIILVVVIALLPLSLFSLDSANRMREHVDALAGARLVANANATAASQREAINLARQLLMSATMDEDIMSGTPRCSREIRAQLLGQQAVMNIARSDAQGRVLCSGLAYEGEVSLAGQPWWESGKTQNRMTLSPPTMGQISQRQTIVAMLPLFGDDGRFVGALTAAISTAWMEAAMKNLRLSSTAMVVLADGNGKVVMQSAGPVLGRLDINMGGSAYRLHTSGPTGDWLYSSAPIFGRDLYVVFAEPQQKLLSVVNRFWVQNLILPIATMIFASLAVWWGIQFHVVRWFGQLSKKASAIAQGKYQPSQFNFGTSAPEIQSFAKTLHQMATDIAAQKTELSTALAHSRALAREINHRVKNNLQILLSLLHMQATRLPGGEARDILEKTLARMSAVSITQRLTYEQSETVDHGTVNMCQLLEALIQQWQVTFANRPQTIKLDCEIEAFPADKAIPIALIVVETVFNAMNHGFGDRATGTVSLSLRRGNAMVILSIEDDGLGFDLQQTPGQLGFSLIEALTLQLGASLSIRSHDGAGTTVTIEMPVRSSVSEDAAG